MEAPARIAKGEFSWEDVQSAVDGGWEKPAISALLEALGAGHERAAELLFAWGVSPDVGKVESDLGEASESKPCVLIFGWGGSSCSQLQAVKKFWQGRNFATLCTTFCSKNVERQVAEIKHAIRGDVLVHVFSNNGMYLLQHLLRTMPQEERTWRLRGVIIDSAPDANLSPMLMRQVVNGCIRALCMVYGVFLEKKPEAALTELNIISPLRVGDCIGPLPAIGSPVVTDASGAARGVLIGAADGDEIVVFLERRLQSKDLEQLKKFQVSKVEIDELSDFLAKEDCPLHFLYSSSDTLIKAPAVEAYMRTCTREGQATCKRFAGSQHVRHFQKHFEQYAAEVSTFSERCLSGS